jgi:hypothetical protein
VSDAKDGAAAPKYGFSFSPTRVSATLSVRPNMDRRALLFGRAHCADGVEIRGLRFNF